MPQAVTLSPSPKMQFFTAAGVPLVGGKLFTSRDASPDNVSQMTEVLADPRSAAIAYGKTFGKCSVCNRDLSDPESVSLGIGPVCAKRFGWQ